MAMLYDQDVNNVVRNLPKDVRALLKANPGRIFLAGGYIRDRISGAPINDIDLWGVDSVELGTVAELFGAKRGVRVMSTDNAHTILTQGRSPVQFITRWVFDYPGACADSFDFTVCSAAIWYEGDRWESYCHNDFYADLAGKRLVYTYPARNEDAGGSLMRVQKLIRRGYSISPGNLAGVIARLTTRFYDDFLHHDERHRARVILGLLREVDPLVVVDGVELPEEDPASE